MNSFTKKIYGEKNPRILIIFSSWPIKSWYLWFLGKLLAAHNFKVIVYSLDRHIFQPDPILIANQYALIKRDAINLIKSLPKRQQNNIGVLGISLGSPLAFMLANELHSVSKIIANLSGANIAQIVWSWNNALNGFKNKLRRKRWTLKKLQNIWFDLSPINNLYKLRGKKILLYAAEKDELIPFTQTKELIQALDERSIKYQTVVNIRHNHAVSCLINILKFDTYLRFLNSK
jgi:esterase/lipase